MPDSPRQQHRLAMDYYSKALVARDTDPRQYLDFLNRAYEIEASVAMQYITDFELEPTRGLIMRSAAVLARELGRPRECEKWVALGLAGEPHADVAEELRHIFEDANFFRHISGAQDGLLEDEIEITVTGSMIRHGGAPLEILARRYRAFDRNIRRAASRRLKLSFPDEPEKVIPQDQIHTGVFAERAASFGLRIRVSMMQISMDSVAGFNENVITPASLISEVAEAHSAFDEEDFEALEQLIPDDQYRVSFMRNAKEMYPDGEDVKTVTLSTSKSLREKPVTMTRKRSEIKRSVFDPMREIVDARSRSETASFTGYLQSFIGKREGREYFEIRLDNGETEKVRATKSEIQETVANHFGQYATVFVRRDRPSARWSFIDLQESESR